MKKLIVILLVCQLTYSIAQPANSYLKKYSGSYYMLANGQKPTAKSDTYVFTSDGKCVWSFYSNNADGTQSVKPTKKQGTWKASEGLIQMNFDMGDGEGSELMTDFTLKDGVFKSEGVYLKKIVTTSSSNPKPETKPKTDTKSKN